MSASDAFDGLQEQYFTLMDNFNRLMAACQTDEQRNALRAAYAQSRDNYNAAINNILNANDPNIDALQAELKSSQGKVEDSLTNLQDISAVIDTIGAAVAVGTKLVTLGSGV